MQINARPNLNGNTSDDFRESARQLIVATTAARKALYAARADVFHGRNYQTVANPDARAEDLKILSDAFVAAQVLAETADAISEATWTREATA